MTLQAVLAYLKQIASEAEDDDDERAHIFEDELYLKILKHHAHNGCPLAQAALKSKLIKFARWCG